MAKISSSVVVRRRPDKPSRPWTVYPRRNGKKLKSTSFGQNKLAARQFADKLLLDMKSDTFKFRTDKGDQTLADYGTEVLSQRGQRKEGSMENYRSTFNCHIKDTPLGQMALAAIDRDDIAKWLNSLSLEDYKYATRFQMFACVRKILNRAVAAKILQYSPCVLMGTEVPKSADDRIKEMDDIKVLTDDQTVELLRRLRHQTSDTRKFGVFYTTDQTGMRIGEAQTIKNHCWDFVHDKILVRHNVSKGRLDTPKGRQKRTLDLTPDLKMFIQALIGPNPDPQAFTFANRRGGFFNYDQLLQDVWNPVADGVGAGHITPHILRHTFAARILQDGKPIAYLSKLLGHASAEFTQKHYSGLVPDDSRLNMNVISRPAPTQLKLVGSRTPGAPPAGA